MYCWNCGHKNPESNKFCGECGKMQVRPPVIVEEDLISDNVKTMNPSTRSRVADDREPSVRAKHERRSVREEEVKNAPVTQAAPPLAPPPGTGITPTRITNPLVEEPRAVKDAPLAAAVAIPSTPARPHEPPMRISGPSFLGLSDASATSDYLLDDEVESSSTARNYIALGLLILFGVLIYKQWDSVSALSKDLAQKAGVTSASTPTPPAPPTTEVAENRANSPEQKPESDQVYHEPEPPADLKAKAEAENPDATEEDASKKEIAPPEPKPEAAKKSATPAPDSEAAVPAVYDDSQIDLAQKYLQGRGVAQDCGRGISLLRSAAAQPNPKAQIKLGALYATGYCVSQDKAEAYRWFAEAHQLQPSNQWIDKNLNSLWSEMTTEERSRVQR